MRQRATIAGPVIDVMRLPPLGYADPAHPFSRSEASQRSVIALLLLAAIALLLILGALRTLGTNSHFGAVPLLFRRAPAEVAERGDRLTLQSREASADHLTRIEQLDDKGAATRPFTHVVARLGADPLPSHPVPVASRLPREILHGASDLPALPPAVSAYAPPDLPSDEPAGVAVNSAVIVEQPPRQVAPPRVVVAKPADTLPQILQALGTPLRDAAAIAGLIAPKGWFGAKAFAGGEKITVLADGAADQPLKVSVERPGKPDIAVARTDDGRYVPVAPVEGDRPHAAAVKDHAHPSWPVGHESLRDGLYAMASAHHIDHTLIDGMIRLCARDIDLDTPLTGRESAELLYSANDLGEPELAFASLKLADRSLRYYRFTAPDDNGTDYYDADGHSVTQSLLRKPVAAGRLGDGFGWRIHPVLGNRRMHEGVDYAAPYGSPIVAAGAGVVELISQQIGYGKYIRIRHDLGYETTYAHISNIAHGLQVGTRVHQGETIAYVGSTGYSTGPHLYYELRINGRNVDPLRVRLRAGRILDGDALTAFQHKRASADLLLKTSMAGSP